MYKHYLVLGAVSLLLMVGPVMAQDSSPTAAAPTGFGQEVREVRQENRQEREQVRTTIQQERKDMITGIKGENQDLRNQWKAETISKTPQQIKALRPTYIEQQKELIQKHVTERESFWTSAQTKWQTVKTDIKSAWSNLFAKWFGGK
jgi:hypothetical protein